MPQYGMRLISEAEIGGRTILTPAPREYAMTGEGDHSYRCGGCKSLLIDNVGHHDTDDIVVKCGKCSKLNEVPPHHH